MLKCCVQSCPNSLKWGKGPFFTVPFLNKIRQVWCDLLGMDINSLDPSSAVCMNHFTEDDVFRFNSRTKLKPGRVPQPVGTVDTANVQSTDVDKKDAKKKICMDHFNEDDVFRFNSLTRLKPGRNPTRKRSNAQGSEPSESDKNVQSETAETSTVPQKEPEPNKVTHKQPESTEVSQKQPETIERAQKEPETSEVAQKEPETSEVVQKEPETTEVVQKEPESTKDKMTQKDLVTARPHPKKSKMKITAKRRRTIINTPEEQPQTSADSTITEEQMEEDCSNKMKVTKRLQMHPHVVPRFNLDENDVDENFSQYPFEEREEKQSIYNKHMTSDMIAEEENSENMNIDIIYENRTSTKTKDATFYNSSIPNKGLQEFVETVSQYFEDAIWNSFTREERQYLTEIYYIYHACKDLGIDVVLPDFMSGVDHDAFPCRICTRSFALEEKREAHEEKCLKEALKITGPSKTLCEYCGEYFKVSCINMHMDQYHRDQEARCLECGIIAPSFMKLAKHMKQHKEETPITCDTCGKQFSSKYNYLAHAKTHRKHNTPFQYANKDLVKRKKATKKLKSRRSVPKRSDYNIAKTNDATSMVLSNQSEVSEANLNTSAFSSTPLNIRVMPNVLLNTSGSNNILQGGVILTPINNMSKLQILNPNTSSYMPINSNVSIAGNTSIAGNVTSILTTSTASTSFRTGAVQSVVRQTKPIVTQSSNIIRKDGLYRCTQCPYTSTSSKSAHIHGNIHPPSLFKCAHCEFLSANQNELKTHLETHFGGTSSACNHVNFNDNSSSMYKCAHCEFLSSDENELRTHLETHFSIGPSHIPEKSAQSKIAGMFKCAHCAFLSPDKGVLINHLQLHIAVQAKINKPGNTSKSQNYIPQKDEHLEVNQKKPAKAMKLVSTFKCERCGYITLDSDDMQLHSEVHKPPALLPSFKEGDKDDEKDFSKKAKHMPSSFKRKRL